MMFPAGQMNGMLSSKTSSEALLIMTDTSLIGIIIGGARLLWRRRVLRMPFLGCFMWPFAVAGLELRYFVIPLAVRFGHPLRYPHQMAFSRVEICGLHKDWCAKRMLFALVCTVCMKKEIWTAGWAWASATTGAANWRTQFACWEVMPWDPNGRVHKSIVGFFSAHKIILLL